MNIRPAAQDDLDLLWQFLAMAAYEPEVAVAKTIPFVATHLDGWQRPTDFGFVAETGGQAVGAAWVRQFAAEESPFFVDDDTPEITIGVIDSVRGQGVGHALLRALIAEAAARRVGLCLNVRETNPARRLYERLGFNYVPGWHARNRVGTLSLGMVLGEVTDNALRSLQRQE
jgi:ribosomal protein S18 acetylase RimI-like enzyme